MSSSSISSITDKEEEADGVPTRLRKVNQPPGQLNLFSAFKQGNEANSSIRRTSTMHVPPQVKRIQIQDDSVDSASVISSRTRRNLEKIRKRKEAFQMRLSSQGPGLLNADGSQTSRSPITPYSHVDDKKTRQLFRKSESKLESQLGDYKIKDNSSISEDSSIHRSKNKSLFSQSFITDEESAASLEEEQFPEAQILSRMEDFYSQNYSHTLLKSIPDFFNSKVWHVQIDEELDLVYVFQAHIKVYGSNQGLEFQQVSDNESPSASRTKMRKSSQFKPLEFSSFREDDAINDVEDSSSDADSDENIKKALQLFSNSRLLLTLTLEIWNIDDRIIRSPGSKALEPLSEHRVLEKEFEIASEMSIFEQMNLIQNQYQDYARLHQDGNLIHFFNDRSQLMTLKASQQRIDRRPFLSPGDDRDSAKQAFTSAIHFKDQGKKSQAAECIVQISYYQTNPNQRLKLIAPKDTSPVQSPKNLHLLKVKSPKKTSTDVNNVPQSVSGSNVNAGGGRVKTIRQRLGLKIFQYSDFTKPKSGTPPKVKEYLVNIDDDRILNYYDPYSREGLENFSIFIRRIAESAVYLVLFPTGLLLQIGTSPFTIHSRIQLSIRKEHPLVDVCYRVDDSFQSQSLWLMDEDFQVWRVSNDLNPSSSNWNLQKQVTHDHIRFKRFFKPAVTFEEQYDTLLLFELNCFDFFKFNEDYHHEYIFAFNLSATKALIVKQPKLVKIGGIEDDQESIPDTSLESIEFQLEQQYSVNKEEINSMTIQIVCIFKVQSTILSRLPQRSKPNSQTRITSYTVSQKARDFKIKILKEITEEPHMKQSSRNLINKLSMSDEVDLDLENLEIVSTGKVYQNKQVQGYLEDDNSISCQRNAFLRQFVVRKRQQVSVMLTNGLNHWIQPIPNSEVKTPFQVHKIVFSQDQRLLAVQYTINQENAHSLVRVFKRNLNGDYEIEPDSKKEAFNKTDMKNIHFSKQSRVHQTEIDLVTDPMRKDKIIVSNVDGLLKIEIYEGLIHRDIYDPKSDLPKLINSPCQQLVLCNRLFIKMNSAVNAVEAIGCILYTPGEDSMLPSYEFKNILDKTQRKELVKQIKQKRSHVLRFNPENPPLFPCGNTFFYILHPITEGLETALIRMKLSKMELDVIYVSKGQVTQADLLQITVLEDKKQNAEPPKTAGLPGPGNGSSSHGRLNSETSLLDKESKSSDSKTPPPTKPLGGGTFLTSSQLGLASTSSLKGGLANMSSALFAQLFQPKKQVNNIMICLLTHTENHILVEILADKVKQSDKVASEEISDGPPLQTKKKSLRRKPSMRSEGESSARGTPRRVKEDDSHETPRTPNKQQPSLFSNFRNNFLRKYLKDQEGKDELDNENRFTVFISAISVFSKSELTNLPMAKWIVKDKLLLLLNSEFFILNLKNESLISVKNQIQYGLQQVNTSMFASFVRLMRDQADPLNAAMNQDIQTAQQSISRMEIASLRKYLQIRVARPRLQDIKTQLLFFIPAEELHGMSLFSKLAGNIKIIQPYLEAISSDFLQYMNNQIFNVQKFTDPNFVILNDIKFSCDTFLEADVKAGGGFDSAAGQMSTAATSQVHMYQDDIMGLNAIDYAFQKNAIFSIKAFVETLLILPDESQFRNCFDKALLLMIKRGINVKELVNSQLFYPQIWKRHQIYSTVEEPIIVPYNNDLKTLECEDPHAIFVDEENEGPDDDSQSAEGYLKRFGTRNSNQTTQQIAADEASKEEQFEMQFNYIYMSEIQGSDKLEVSKTLMECQDIGIFEQESIQHIIDYKWDTYARDYFLFRFLFYFVFLLLYYVDVEWMPMDPGSEGTRDRNFFFYAIKVICSIIQLYFFWYELKQMKEEFQDYFLDPWNYMEVAGNVFFAWGAYIDVFEQEITDDLRIILALSIIFTLIKLVYLVRVFRNLNFLVTMFITVVNDIVYFMILFLIFVLTFAESYHMLGVDTQAYGRIPALGAHVIAVLRSTMGDFSLINPYEGFDILDEDSPDGHKHSQKLVIVTFGTFIVCQFFLFMIFMNFIIAVIGTSYQKVIKSKEAFDYKQRASMISEREVHFSPQQLADERYFPKVLVVRKKKDNNTEVKNDLLSVMIALKTFIKSSTGKCIEMITAKSVESKQLVQNAIKQLETDIGSLAKEMEKIQSIIERNFRKFSGKRRTGNQRKSDIPSSEADSSQFTSALNSRQGPGTAVKSIFKSRTGNLDVIPSIYNSSDGLGSQGSETSRPANPRANIPNISVSNMSQSAMQEILLTTTQPREREGSIPGPRDTQPNQQVSNMLNFQDLRRASQLRRSRTNSFRRDSRREEQQERSAAVSVVRIPAPDEVSSSQSIETTESERQRAQQRREERKEQLQGEEPQWAKEMQANFAAMMEKLTSKIEEVQAENKELKSALKEVVECQSAMAQAQKEFLEEQTACSSIQKELLSEAKQTKEDIFNFRSEVEIKLETIITAHEKQLPLDEIKRCTSQPSPELPQGLDSRYGNGDTMVKLPLGVLSERSPPRTGNDTVMKSFISPRLEILSLGHQPSPDLSSVSKLKLKKSPKASNRGGPAQSSRKTPQPKPTQTTKPKSRNTTRLRNNKTAQLVHRIMVDGGQSSVFNRGPDQNNFIDTHKLKHTDESVSRDSVRSPSKQRSKNISFEQQPPNQIRRSTATSPRMETVLKKKGRQKSRQGHSRREWNQQAELYKQISQIHQKQLHDVISSRYSKTRRSQRSKESNKDLE